MMATQPTTCHILRRRTAAHWGAAAAPRCTFAQ